MNCAKEILTIFIAHPLPSESSRSHALSLLLLELDGIPGQVVWASWFRFSSLLLARALLCNINAQGLAPERLGRRRKLSGRPPQSYHCQAESADPLWAPVVPRVAGFWWSRSLPPIPQWWFPAQSPSKQTTRASTLALHCWAGTPWEPRPLKTYHPKIHCSPGTLSQQHATLRWTKGHVVRHAVPPCALEPILGGHHRHLLFRRKYKKKQKERGANKKNN